MIAEALLKKEKKLEKKLEEERKVKEKETKDRIDKQNI
jgi:hypothetical protein